MVLRPPAWTSLILIAFGADMCALEAQRPTALPAPRSPQKSAWSVDPQFQLRIAPNDTLEFGMVIGLSMLSDGGVVLASHRSNSIQFFDAQGRRTKSVGRRGRGPGEFTGVSQFLRFGDTLVLVDLRGIAQLFSSTGKYVRSESKLGSNVERLGYFSNGDRLVSTSMTDHLSPGRGSRRTMSLREFPRRRAFSWAAFRPSKQCAMRAELCPAKSTPREIA